MPKVTVVIPCYNHGGFLEETLYSLENQTFSDFEVIIVNDGSTDAATVTLLQRINRPGIKVLHHAVNKGVSAARNMGITESDGVYILPLDADDKIGPEYLELAVNVLDSRLDVALVYFDRMLFGEREGLASLPDYDPKELLFENCLYAPVFRKDDWDAVGGFCNKFVYGWEDWDFWISLSELNKRVVKIPKPLFFYRIRQVSRDRSLGRSKKIAMFSLMVMRHKSLYFKNLGLIWKKMSSLLMTGIQL